MKHAQDARHIAPGVTLTIRHYSGASMAQAEAKLRAAIAAGIGVEQAEDRLELAKTEAARASDQAKTPTRLRALGASSRLSSEPSMLTSAASAPPHATTASQTTGPRPPG